MCVSSSTTWPTDAKREARSAKREAKRKKTTEPHLWRTASPVFFPFGHSVRLDHGRRTVCVVEERDGRARQDIRVERQRESRRSERLGRRAIERVRGKQKNLATLSSLPSPPALQSVCNKGRVIGTGSLLGEIR